eukprot:gene5338-6730_t
MASWSYVPPREQIARCMCGVRCLFAAVAAAALTAVAAAAIAVVATSNVQMIAMLHIKRFCSSVAFLYQITDSVCCLHKVGWRRTQSAPEVYTKCHGCREVVHGEYTRVWRNRKCHGVITEHHGAS